MVVYRRLLSISARYWAVFVAVAVAAATFAATDAGFAYMMTILTEIVGAGDDLDERQALIKEWLPLGILLLFIVRGLGNFLSSFGMGWIARTTIKELRRRVFERYLVLPTRFFNQRSSGQLLSKITYDVGQVASSASTVVITLIKDSLTIVFLVGYMLYLSFQLSLFVFIIAPMIAGIVRYLGVLFRRHNKKIQESMGNITRITQEALEAHKIVKIFGGRSYESERFNAINERNRRMELRLLTATSAGDGINMLVSAFGIAGVIYLISQIDLEVSRVMGFITAMVLLMSPLKRLTNINASIQRGVAAGESLFRVIDEEAERDTGTENPERIEGRVEFRNVSFSYSGTNVSVLNDINLVVEPGETLAIVGRSGSGKSTLVSLLPRFYDIDSGQILIDGLSVDEYSLEGLRRHISLVSQEVTLFNDTVEANIAYGGLAGASTEEIRQAVLSANAEEFVAALPDGLATMVGDRGVLLSGGQRQRLSIARALLKDSPILILDEATSALDTESERHIQAALEQLMQNRTTFVIAHRLSTIENADRIIVMEEGRIVESGKHEDLLATAGHYAALHRMQFSDDDARQTG
ncbi:MAG: lipid A export permease/ATP-binding protein MsbA [Gammaproteobacteria bacterium]|nr:lipid A export permease/ATP-binding protein MsbA [Gammaproteobacteria bacterium]MDP6615864.1 lipid A export permease/ATP-binding protein MsbA [Gammaproteobacteria bacterium]MDP6694318.1 lipid A export permease/ATP-binding protein MsbA [Gammaproteobacteria bacterium]